MYISCIELTSTKHVEKSTSRTPGELVSKRVIRALRSRQTYKRHVMISIMINDQLVASFIFHSRDNQIITSSFTFFLVFIFNMVQNKRNQYVTWFYLHRKKQMIQFFLLQCALHQSTPEQGNGQFLNQNFFLKKV